MPALNSLNNSPRPLFPRGPGIGVKTLILLFACGCLMAAEVDGDKLEKPRDWISVALSPVVWVSEIPSHLSDISKYFSTRNRLLAENELLKSRQLQLEAQLQKYASLRAENLQIRNLLQASKKLIDHVAVVDIMAANQDPYRQQIALNKGARDGVYRGQAIVDAKGVLGQVIRVLPRTAIALLVTDPDHGIPVEVNRTGLQAIALGQGNGQGLRLSFLPANAEIEQGDLVVSSSLGGRFPAGFPVGRVVKVSHTPGGHFKEAVAMPAAQVGRGRQALLVWSEHPVIDQDQAEDAIAAEAIESGVALEQRPAKPARAAPAP